MNHSGPLWVWRPRPDSADVKADSDNSRREWPYQGESASYQIQGSAKLVCKIAFVFVLAFPGTIQGYVSGVRG